MIGTSCNAKRKENADLKVTLYSYIFMSLNKKYFTTVPIFLNILYAKEGVRWIILLLLFQSRGCVTAEHNICTKGGRNTTWYHLHL